LCEDLYGKNVAVVACFLAAISPYLARYAAHVRTESPFFLLTTLAVLLFYRGLTELRPSRFFYGGLVAGLAYLVRPEAIGLLVIVPMVLVCTWWFKRERNLGWSAKACALLCAGFFIFALPYIFYLSWSSGQWGSVSKKAGLTFAIALKDSGLLENEGSETVADLDSLTLVQFVARHPVLYVEKVLLDIPASIGVYLEGLHYTYVPFLLIGLFLSLREKFWLRKDFLLISFVAFYLIGFTLILVRRRYSLQMLTVSLPWIAAGVMWCWVRLREIASVKTFRIVAVTGLLLFLGATLPKTLKPISPEKAYVREAGRYIKTVDHSPQRNVFVFDDRITFYGDSNAILLSGLDEKQLLEQIRRREASYLATEVNPWQQRFPKIALNPTAYGLAIDKEFRASKRDTLLVFKVL